MIQTGVSHLVKSGRHGVQCRHAVEQIPSSIPYRRKAASEAKREVALCLRTATHAVAGRPFCSLHAGHVLLAEATRVWGVDTLVRPVTSKLQCRAPISASNWREECRARDAARLELDPNHCFLPATHEVRKLPFCQLHAGYELLRVSLAIEATASLQAAWDAIDSLPAITFTEAEAARLLDAIDNRRATGGGR